jgi:hypothetical protein
MICTTLALLLLQGAPPPVYAIASTTSDSRLPQDTICRDEELFRRDYNDSWPRVMVTQQTWMSFLGDMDSDGLFDFPAGIDAVALAAPDSTTTPTLMDLWFSSDQDFLGFQDGDILHLSPMGGVEVIYSEADLYNLLQPTSGAIDIDALHFMENKVVRLSLANNLTGTILGDLQDGDILDWTPEANIITVVATEADVQAWVNHATGGTAAIGDVKALSMLPNSMVMAFTVQAPTAIDASVFSNENGGSLIPGWEENDWSFQQSSELDALCFVPATLGQPLVLSTDVAYVQPGAPIQLRMHHATPGAPLQGMVGTTFSIRSQFLGQAGISVVNPYQGFSRTWPARNQPPLIADSSGSASYDAMLPNLPPGATSLTLWCQAADPTGQGWSTPIVLRLE